MPRGRPKKAPLSQRSIYDVVLEDPDLEDLLERADASYDVYKQHRATREAIKERLKEHHPHVVQGFLDEPQEPDEIVRGPYAICGQHRFMAAAPLRPAVTDAVAKDKAKGRPASHGWRFESARLDESAGEQEEPPDTYTDTLSVDGKDAQPVRRTRRKTTADAAQEFLSERAQGLIDDIEP